MNFKFNRDRLTNVLLWTIRVGVLVVLFLPLVMHSQFFFPFIVFKNVLFRITVEVVFAAYLLLAYLRPEYRPHWNGLTIAVGAFFGAMIVSGLLGLGLYRSFWGNYERMSGIVHYLHLIMYFAVLAFAIRRREFWNQFFTFSVFASVLMSFLAFAQWLKVPFLLASSGGDRLTGTVGNAAFFAAYLLFNIMIIAYGIAKKRFDLKMYAYSFIVFDVTIVVMGILNKMFVGFNWGVFNILKFPLLNEALSNLSMDGRLSVPALILFLGFIAYQAVVLVTYFARQEKKFLPVVLGLTLLFEAFILWNTQTRGVIVGLLVAVAVVAVVMVALMLTKAISVARPVKYGIFVALAAVLIAPLLLFQFKDTSVVKNNGTLNRLATISLNDVTTESRVLTWKASWQGWIETPKTFMFGYGPEHYYYAFNKHFPTEIYRDAGSQIWFDRAHNMLFDIAVPTGMVGLLSFAAILSFAVWFLFRYSRSTNDFVTGALLTGLFVAYVVQNMFVFDTFNTEVLLFLILGYVVFLYRSIEPTAEIPPAKEINVLYAAVVMVVLLFGIFAVNVRTIQANNLIYRAFQEENVAARFDLHKQSIERANVGLSESRQQLGEYIMNAVRSGQGVTPAMITYTEEQLQKDLELEPKNARHFLFYGNFYNSINRAVRDASAKAEPILLQGIPLSPTRPQFYFELGQSYLFQNKVDLAQEQFEKGFQLSPTVIDSARALLSFYIVTQKYDLADEQLRYMKETLAWEMTKDDYVSLITAYSANDNYEKMIALSLELATQQPVAENYARLAAVYAEAGQVENAIEAARKAMALDPAYTEEAQRFIEQVQSR